MNFTIRDLKNYDEMLAVHQLQQKIWGLTDPDMGLYPPLLNTAAKNGGVVLGAFDDQTGQMIAFLFSFLGREPGGVLKLCSQAMGVLPEWRGLGVAEALKRVQRERAVVQGLSLITWTFDPLEAPNAHLNLHKLRAISRSYWRDIYGSNFGELNAGLPTDRLVAEWWLLGSRVTSCIEMLPLEIEAAIPIFVAAGRAPDRQIVQVRLELEAEFLQLEIPADIHPVKAANMALALAWRLQVRQALENYLAKGYIITDFISAVDQGERQNRYILQRSGPGLLAEIGLAE